MSFTIVVKEQAREDLLVAALWYETQSKGLGEQFVAEYQLTVGRIKLNPYISQIRRKKLRQSQLKKFPYLIVYSISKSTIVIYGIIHGKQNPSKKLILKRRK